MAEPKPRVKSPGDAADVGPPPVDTLSTYHQTIRGLSDRLVEAQRPIRILDALRDDLTPALRQHDGVNLL